MKSSCAHEISYATRYYLFRIGLGVTNLNACAVRIPPVNNCSISSKNIQSFQNRFTLDLDQCNRNKKAPDLFLAPYESHARNI